VTEKYCTHHSARQRGQQANPKLLRNINVYMCIYECVHMCICASLMFDVLWQIHKGGADTNRRCIATIKETNGNVGDAEEVMLILLSQYLYYVHSASD